MNTNPLQNLNENKSIKKPTDLGIPNINEPEYDDLATKEKKDVSSGDADEGQERREMRK